MQPRKRHLRPLQSPSQPLIRNHQNVIQIPNRLDEIIYSGRRLRVPSGFVLEDAECEGEFEPETQCVEGRE